MKLEKLESKAHAASDLLKVLSSPSRLQIMCQLVDGPKSVQQLEGAVGLRQSALSQHLAILRREKLVTTRRESQFIYYSLHSTEAMAIIRALYQIYCAPRSKAK